MGVDFLTSLQDQLLVKIGEVSGKNKNDEFVWDVPNLEGFIRIEIQGGQYSVQASTKKVQLQDNKVMVFDEDMVLNVPQGSTEFRILLCYERQLSPNRTATQALAACGIFIKDIQQASPISKNYQLFKPMHADEGGFINIQITYTNAETASQLLLDSYPMQSPSHTNQENSHEEAAIKQEQKEEEEAWSQQEVEAEERISRQNLIQEDKAEDLFEHEEFGSEEGETSSEEEEEEEDNLSILKDEQLAFKGVSKEHKELLEQFLNPIPEQKYAQPSPRRFLSFNRVIISGALVGVTLVGVSKLVTCKRRLF